MRAIHTIADAANRKRVADHADLVAELAELVPTMHPQHQAYAAGVLADVASWTPKELAPLLPRLRNLDKHAKEWDTLTPEQRTQRGNDAYFALYRERRS